MPEPLSDFLSNPTPLEVPPSDISDSLGVAEENAFKKGDYDDYQKRYIEIVLDNLEKEADLRKREFKKLSYIAIGWTLTIILITIVQGFGAFPVQWFTGTFSYLKFNLSNQAYIALVTTTTATILGLYTIAAYWLYRKDALTFDFLKKTDKENNIDQ
ncbi:hypothetical protein D7V64_15050 [Acinetobacter cumulans]|uniref:Uncharacterized protein n=1 Tax=Acinetobacter cumulans TaxID=2136182 RepID=A0A3A8FQN8_9GAMM|nr:hypothetical protein [Acinetobacter cumulans]RKG48499.1 hypothetical protein D7V64_15050 [Acinetobacter cumulans]